MVNKFLLPECLNIMTFFVLILIRQRNLSMQFLCFYNNANRAYWDILYNKHIHSSKIWWNYFPVCIALDEVYNLSQIAPWN